MSTEGTYDIVGYLTGIVEQASDDLSTAVEIEKAGSVPAVGGLPLEKTAEGKYKWHRIDDVSVVATDLKASTAVSYSKQDRVGARLYQASTGNCARVLQQFTPSFVDIQGDGLFAIFSGERHAERAMTATVSLNSFGQRLALLLKEQLGDDVPEMQESGLKVGADRGTLLVKRIGVRGEHNEPVWAGKPVNYATKCAQEAEAGRVIATSRFFNGFRDNEYVRWTCGCKNGVPAGEVVPLWRKVTVDALGEQHQNCRELVSRWCENCGNDFAASILAGEKDRGLNTGQLKKWREDPEPQPA